MDKERVIDLFLDNARVKIVVPIPLGTLLQALREVRDTLGELRVDTSIVERIEEVTAEQALRVQRQLEQAGVRCRTEPTEELERRLRELYRAKRHARGEYEEADIEDEIEEVKELLRLPSCPALPGRREITRRIVIEPKKAKTKISEIIKELEQQVNESIKQVVKQIPLLFMEKLGIQNCDVEPSINGSSIKVTVKCDNVKAIWRGTIDTDETEVTANLYLKKLIVDGSVAKLTGNTATLDGFNHLLLTKLVQRKYTVNLKDVLIGRISTRATLEAPATYPGLKKLAETSDSYLKEIVDTVKSVSKEVSLIGPAPSLKGVASVCREQGICSSILDGPGCIKTLVPDDPVTAARDCADKYCRLIETVSKKLEKVAKESKVKYTSYMYACDKIRSDAVRAAILCELA